MIVIIDYGMGNLGSVLNMLRICGAEAKITSDISDIEKAEKLIIPGVGSFDSGIRQLEQRGLIPVLNKKVLEEKRPILGICLGMQLLGNGSDEGVLPGLGWIDAETIRFDFSHIDQKLRVPHMGWNSIEIKKTSPLFDAERKERRFYFVHSYHVRCKKQSDILAEANHGFDFTAALHHDNIFGTQFHPEKSHRFGKRLLTNFIERVPC